MRDVNKILIVLAVIVMVGASGYWLGERRVGGLEDLEIRFQTLEAQLEAQQVSIAALEMYTKRTRRSLPVSSGPLFPTPDYQIDNLQDRVDCLQRRLDGDNYSSFPC